MYHTLFSPITACLSLSFKLQNFLLHHKAKELESKQGVVLFLSNVNGCLYSSFQGVIRYREDKELYILK